jgi:hypothetical protein
VCYSLHFIPLEVTNLKKEIKRRSKYEAYLGDCGISQAIVKVGPDLKELLGTGRVLIDGEIRKKIDVRCGEKVLIHAPWFLTAAVEDALNEDVGKNIIRIDEKLRKKGGLSTGVDVWIRKHPLDEDKNRR